MSLKTLILIAAMYFILVLTLTVTVVLSVIGMYNG